MDLLFKKYADPFLFVDQMILTCRFSEFVDKIIKIHNDEEINKTRWELWLHKVFDKSYTEFLELFNEKAEIGNESENSETTMPKEDIKNQIKLSIEVWKEFK